MLSKAASSIIFLSLWYDSTLDWTPVSRTIGKDAKKNKKIDDQKIDSFMGNLEQKMIVRERM